MARTPWAEVARSPAEARLQQERQKQVRWAKAAIYLACEKAGPYMAVVLLNDALRAALDKLQDEAPGRPGEAGGRQGGDGADRMACHKVGR
jgi:hypothetical protein